MEKMFALAMPQNVPSFFFFIIIMQVAFEKVLVESLHGSVLAVSVCDLYLHSFTLMLVCLCAHAHVSCLKPQLYSQFLVLVIKGV